MVLAVKDIQAAPTPRRRPAARIQIVRGGATRAVDRARARVRRRGLRGRRQRPRSARAARLAPASSELCSAWRDPRLRSSRARRSTTRARARSPPTCRWSTRTCKDQGRRSVPRPTMRRRRRAPAEGVRRLLLTRARASNRSCEGARGARPVWYRPESIAAVPNSIRELATAAAAAFDLDRRARKFLPADVAQGAASLTLTAVERCPRCSARATRRG